MVPRHAPDSSPAGLSWPAPQFTSVDEPGTQLRPVQAWYRGPGGATAGQLAVSSPLFAATVAQGLACRLSSPKFRGIDSSTRKRSAPKLHLQTSQQHACLPILARPTSHPFPPFPPERSSDNNMSAAQLLNPKAESRVRFPYLKALSGRCPSLWILDSVC